MVLRCGDLCRQGHQADAELREDKIQANVDRQTAEPFDNRHCLFPFVDVPVLYDRLRHLGESRWPLLSGLPALGLTCAE